MHCDLGSHPLCASLTSSSQSLKTAMEPQQVFLEPSVMTWAGGRADTRGDAASATYPADTTVLLRQYSPKGPRLTYLFNLDYTTRLPSGNEG